MLALLLLLVVTCCAGQAIENDAAPLKENFGGSASAEESHMERQQPQDPVSLAVLVLRELPHQKDVYTQGLLVHDGLIYESRGHYGRSGIDVWDPETGATVKTINLGEEFFAEGLVRVGESLWQLTWQAGRAFRWRLSDLALIQEASFPGEGWGLAFDGKRLIVSNGTHELQFFDPVTFAPLGTLSVRRGASPQDQLNELEYVSEGNVLFANVYETDEIVRIDLETGVVTGVVQASGLLSAEEQRTAEVLNGIAYWPERDSFVITGKFWPKSFEVRFVDEEPVPQ